MNKQLLHTHEDNCNGHEYKIEFWTSSVPTVTLIDYPANARQTLARVTRGYTGRYDTEPMTEQEVAQHLKDLKSTKLGTPAEMLNFTFLIRDVPRSFTHQMVRTRVGAAYVQESTRFIGAKDVYGIIVPKTVHNGARIDPTYLMGNINAIASYEETLSHVGVASQDARQLLPHSVLTHLYASYSLKALMGVYEVRNCCQAEQQWYMVVKQMKQLVGDSCGSDISDFITSPIDRGQSCGFNASFDRACAWKVR